MGVRRCGGTERGCGAGDGARAGSEGGAGE